MIAVFFYHKTTRVPWTWLAPTVTGANLNANTLVVNGATMSESVLPGWYTHPYNMDSEINYAFTFEPNDSDYIYAFKEAFIPARWGGGGGGSFNLSGVTGSINNLSKLVKEENEKMKEFITQENIDTNSHIDIAKWEINDKIEKIEIPEAILEEKEAKKALKIVTSIDKKLSGYIESEMKEKEEKKMEEEEKKKSEMKEKEEKKMEEEEKKKEEARIAELLNAEFDKLEEQDKEEKRKELEKELEETLKEAEELKKELKTL